MKMSFFSSAWSFTMIRMTSGKKDDMSRPKLIIWWGGGEEEKRTVT